MAGRGDRPGGRLCRPDAQAVRLRRHPRAVRRAASACLRWDACGHRPLRPRDLRRRAGRAGRHGHQRHAAGRLRRPSSGPEPGQCRGTDRADDERRRTRLRRGFRRRRRPQHDRRPRHRRHALGQPGDPRRQRAPRRRAIRGGIEGHRALDAHQRRGRPRRGEAWACPATRRRPAGSSSATCSMPAWSRCAARRATAPARTTCARRTACGRCCSG